MDGVTRSLAGWTLYLRPSLLLLLWGTALCYAVQLPGPLRLNTDAMVFLHLASDAAQAPGPVPVVHSPMHPPGYPTLLAILIRTGLANAPMFVALNLVGIGIGLWAFGRFARLRLRLSPNEIMASQAVTLLSFVMIKHAFIPLSDPVFFGLSMLALWAASELERAPAKGWWLAFAALLSILAISVRSVGIALVPALVLALVPRRRLAVCCTCAAAGLLAVIPLSRTGYFQAFIRNHAESGSVERTAWARLSELGELWLNLPQSRAAFLPGPVFLGFGILLLVLFLAGIWSRRREFGAIEVYALAYAAILAIWPFGDTRFWLPVLPLLAGFVFRLFRGAPRILPGLCMALFVLPGIAALAYSCRLSFSGTAFPERYGDGTLRAAYRAAWTGQGGDTDQEKDVVSLLSRFEPRLTVTKR